MFSIDHLGIAVKSLAAAKEFYSKLGMTPSAEEVVEGEQVRLAMVPAGESRIELLEAGDHALSDFEQAHLDEVVAFLHLA